MRRTLRALTAVSALAAGSAHAQGPPAPSRPGPETRKLGYFVGTWRGQSQMKPGPFGPGGRITGTDTCEWFAGGFHLICRSQGTGVRGTFRGMSIMSWNAQEKAYSYYAFDHKGTTEVARGTFDGTTWTWSSDSTLDGKSIRGRYTVT
ncbi:MAG TPA: DUF1579 family protein, partial [Vicinamibacteria bacterium]|nr:DUF1579 family protein [Vicinamibacteria bacterium]